MATAREAPSVVRFVECNRPDFRVRQKNRMFDDEPPGFVVLSLVDEWIYCPDINDVEAVAYEIVALFRNMGLQDLMEATSSEHAIIVGLAQHMVLENDELLIHYGFAVDTSIE